jgi:diaminopimelate epimerase
LNRHEVRALIWERGAGHTLASGSSASAVVAACRDRGLVDGAVTVRMEGGDLKIEIDDQGEVQLEGPTEEICSGTFSAELKARLAAMEGARS